MVQLMGSSLFADKEKCCTGYFTVNRKTGFVQKDFVVPAIAVFRYLLPLGILLHLSNIFSMKLYLKNFLPDFRPVKGSDASFDLRDFKDKDFICPIKEGDMGVYVISGTTKYVYPNGKESPVIYIGMSDNLFRRLKDEHFTKGLKRLIKDKDWGIEKNIILSSKSRGKERAPRVTP